MYRNVNNQKGNKAHVVEFIGGLSIFDFISDNNNETIVDGNQRIVAKTTKTLAYGLKNDSHYIKFPDFPNETNRLCIKPLIKY